MCAIDCYYCYLVKTHSSTNRKTRRTRILRSSVTVAVFETSQGVLGGDEGGGIGIASYGWHDASEGETLHQLGRLIGPSAHRESM